MTRKEYFEIRDKIQAATDEPVDIWRNGDTIVVEP